MDMDALQSCNLHVKSTQSNGAMMPNLPIVLNSCQVRLSAKEVVVKVAAEQGFLQGSAVIRSTLPKTLNYAANFLVTTECCNMCW